VLAYPILVVDQAGALQPYANWLWYRNVEAGPALDALLTDRAGVLHEVALPPAAAQQQDIEALYADAVQQLPPPLASLVRGTAEPFIRAVFDKVGVLTTTNHSRASSHSARRGTKLTPSIGGGSVGEEVRETLEACDQLRCGGLLSHIFDRAAEHDQRGPGGQFSVVNAAGKR
jgi:hypothetical protein